MVIVVFGFVHVAAATVCRNAGSVTLRVSSMERNLSLSPISMALLMMGTSAFRASSIGTGGMFSPPAVMISSVKKINLN